MSKKPNPNAAFSQTLTAEQKAHYEHALVFSTDASMTYLFSTAAATVAIVSPAYVFESFKDFMAKVTDQQLEQFHGMISDHVPTKEQRADRVEWCVFVWMKLCASALNRLSEVKSDGRKTSAKMLNRKYELIKTDIPAELKMPPQSKTCLEFLAELCKNDAAYQAIALADRGVFSVTEEALKAYVVDQSPRLKTRQDPWRIFQYYRPELIKGGFIRLV